MKFKKLLVATPLLVLAIGAARADFNITDFSTAGLVLNGGAAIDGTALQLTMDSGGGQSSQGWLTTPQNVSGDFTASFTFTIVADTGILFGSGPNGADGFTMTFQNDPRGTAASGASGGQLGYGQAITPSIAIGVDTFTTNAVQLYENGVISPAIATGPAFGNLTGGPHTVTVDYTNDTDTLEVSLDGTEQFSDDLGASFSSLVDGSTAIVGFTGGDGGAYSQQEIQSASLSTTSVPEPCSALLGLVGVGMLGVRRHRRAS